MQSAAAEVNDPFYILAASAPDERSQVLKQGDTFAVFDRFGDIGLSGLGEHGLFHEGTRFLSRWQMTLNGGRPLLLSSTVTKDNLLLAVDLTNPDYNGDVESRASRDVIHVFRSKFLWRG